MTRCVVKVGGSLLARPNLGQELVALLADFGGEPAMAFALLVGGGGFADEVRHLDAVHSLPDSLADRLAIEAMGLNARVLAHLLTDTPLADSLSATHKAWSGGATRVILAAVPFLASCPTALPASWSVTSDSLALHAARSLSASRLLLCKSVGAEVLEGAGEVRLAEAVAREWLDPYFPHLVVPDVRIDWYDLPRGVGGPLVTGSAPARAGSSVPTP